MTENKIDKCILLLNRSVKCENWQQSRSYLKSIDKYEAQALKAFQIKITFFFAKQAFLGVKENPILLLSILLSACSIDENLLL